MNGGEEERKIGNGDKIKLIQEKVVIGKGSGEFYIETDFDFRDYSFCRIESSSTSVDIYKIRIISENKAIFNSWVYKSIVYETVDNELGEMDAEGIITIDGELKHKTKRIPLNGFINIEAIKENDRVNPKRDLPEVINAYVSAEIEDEEMKSPIKNQIIKYRMYNGINYLYRERKNRIEISSDPIYIYKKLKVNMVIKINIRIVRIEEVSIEM